jgi:hypothetical protein
LTTQDFILLTILDAFTFHHLQLLIFRTNLFVYHDSLSYFEPLPFRPFLVAMDEILKLCHRGDLCDP